MIRAGPVELHRWLDESWGDRVRRKRAAHAPVITREKMVASLEPRRYKINHTANEYLYFVTWMAGVPKPWAIEAPGGKGGPMYLTERYCFDFQGHDTLYFDTADEALVAWAKFIEVRGD